MAKLRFATLQARQKLQELWEQGMAVKDLSTALEVPPVHPLHGTAPGPLRDRLPDQRLQYDATLAQLRMQQELERRGKQAAEMHPLSQNQKEAHHETHYFEDPDKHR